MVRTEDMFLEEVVLFFFSLVGIVFNLVAKDLQYGRKTRITWKVRTHVTRIVWKARPQVTGSRLLMRRQRIQSPWFGTVILGGRDEGEKRKVAIGRILVLGQVVSCQVVSCQVPYAVGPCSR